MIWNAAGWESSAPQYPISDLLFSSGIKEGIAAEAARDEPATPSEGLQQSRKARRHHR